MAGLVIMDERVGQLRIIHRLGEYKINARIDFLFQDADFAIGILGTQVESTTNEE